MTDAFATPASTTTQTDDVNGNTSVPDLTLVGEGKKFKTVQDLEKGKIESDQFIEQLQGELQGLREDLASRVSVEEALNKLTTQNTSQSTGGDTSPALDAETLSKLVAEQVNQLDTQKVKQSNVQAANDKLAEVFGDKAAEHLASKAVELGVAVDFLKATAETSPQAFYNLVGLNVTTTPNTQASQGTINATSFNNSTNDSESWESYEKMRKENPREYWSPETQQKLFQAKRDGKF